MPVPGAEKTPISRGFCGCWCAGSANRFDGSGPPWRARSPTTAAPPAPAPKVAGVAKEIPRTCRRQTPVRLCASYAQRELGYPSAVSQELSAREGSLVMGISFSIFLIAVGAILAWAVNAEVSGIDVQVAGVILVVVGVIGLIASLIFWSSWGGFGNRDAGAGGGQNTTVVER